MLTGNPHAADGRNKRVEAIPGQLLVSSLETPGYFSGPGTPALHQILSGFGRITGKPFTVLLRP